MSRPIQNRFMAVIILLLVGVFALMLGGCTVGPLSFGGDPAPATPGVGNAGRVTGPTAPPPTATPALRALGGKVLDAYSGRPIAAAEVTAGGILTETTGDGSFSFDALPLDAQLAVKSEGYADSQVNPVQSVSVTVKLRPNTLSGRVTDATTGKPLAGVLVKLMKQSPEPTAPATVTGTTGITATVAPASTPTTTGSLLFGKGLAAPLQAQEAQAQLTSVIEPPASPAGAEQTEATVSPTEEPVTSTPPTPTSTPKPIPPTGPDFVAVYTDDDGSYFFKDVPENASLTLKMPGYKLTKIAAGETTKNDVALEVFKPEAIYVTAPVASTKDLFDGLLQFVQQSRINAIVLNVQNDNSEWVFDTKNPDAINAKNTDVFLPNMPELVKELKNKGIYMIARVVTFQQPTMAKARLDMAVKSSATGKAWIGGQLSQQAWLDASVPAVQDYLVAMTKEVLQLGFDEIQYDYVRFPSDPAPKEPGKPVYSQPLTDTTKALAIEQFLTKAHAVIEPTDAFMSIDIFGYTLWPDQDGKPLNGPIGQVFERMVGHTDYICPMIYPSHFSPGESGCPKPAACAYKLVHRSGEFAERRFAAQRAKYRPWLEDFDWMDGTDYTSPGTTKVAEQMQAAQETGAWGWQWWDAANQYQPRPAFNK